MGEQNGAVLMEILSDTLAWFSDSANWTGDDGIPARVLEHIWLTIVPMVIAVVVAVPPALYLAHKRKGAFFANALVNIGRAIPSFGVIIIAGLFFVRQGVSLRFWPVVVALVALAIPPIFTNAYTAIAGVDPAMTEAARGMGLSEREVLVDVEMPIGANVLLAGIRIALVQVVATVTIGAIISSGGGLGRYIVDGFARGPAGHAEVFAGAILLGILTLAAEGAFTLLERLVLPPGVQHLTREAAPAGAAA